MNFLLPLAGVTSCTDGEAPSLRYDTWSPVCSPTTSHCTVKSAAGLPGLVKCLRPDAFAERVTLGSGWLGRTTKATPSDSTRELSLPTAVATAR
jgi:hypothetical protein